MNKIKIGTRDSALALAQVNIFIEQLVKFHPDLNIEIVKIVTTGDRLKGGNLYDVGGKGLFIKEIEEALLADNIDLAVHSSKDMPALYPQELDISCFLTRQQPHDALLCAGYSSIKDLPDGTVVGTSSPRRMAQILAIQPMVKIVPLRGNVLTRINKLKNQEVGATILAMAGLNRLNIKDPIIHPITIDEILPAVGQGAIVIETKKHDKAINKLIAQVNHQETSICVNAERVFQAEFEGSCRTPIAAYAQLDKNQLHLRCLIAKSDGSKILRTERKGLINDAAAMAKDAAIELKKQAGDKFFD